MLEWLTNAVLKEINNAVVGVVNTIQRRILRMVLKAFFIVAGIAALAVGLIIMGSKYVGVDLMLLLTGVVFVLVFLFL